MHQQIFAILLGFGFASALLFPIGGVVAIAIGTTICGLAYYLAQARDGSEVVILGLIAILPMLVFSSAFLSGAVVGRIFRSATPKRQSLRLAAVAICVIAVTAFVVSSKSSEAARNTSYAETRAKAIAAAKELVSNDPRVIALTGQVQEIPLTNEMVNRDIHKLVGVSLYVKGLKGSAQVETRVSGEGETLQMQIVSVQISN
jgi:hypothetical protein